MLRDSVSRHGVLTAPWCTITAVSKDLVRRPTRISYDLSLATLSHELGGCLLADFRHDPPGSYSTSLRGTPLVCSYYVSMRKHPRDFWRDVSVKIIVETGAVKLLITRRDEPSRLSSSGVPFRRTTACPRRPQLGCDPAPRSKKD